MNNNAALLNFVYKNSQMGTETLKQLTDKYDRENEDFTQLLRNQYLGYEEINSQAKKLLNTHGCDEEGLSKLEEVKTYFMINMQTLKDRSCSHFAEMMITGSSMGITDAIKSLNSCPNADEDVKQLMEHLKTFEESNVEKLKKFL